MDSGANEFMFPPVFLVEGLYMGKLLCTAELSAASVRCAALLSPFGYHHDIALVVKTRSSAQHVSNSAVPLAEIEISSHCASPPDNGVPLVLVKDCLLYTSPSPRD